MLKRIFVGNLPYGSSEDEIRSIFEAHGKVDSVQIVTDRTTGRSRGFAFVDMERSQAELAIESLNGLEMDGRPLRIDAAQPKPAFSRKPRGFPPDSGLMVERRTSYAARA